MSSLGPELQPIRNHIVAPSRGLDGHKPWPVDYDPAAAFGLDNDWVCVTCSRPLRMESISGDGPEFAHHAS